MNLLPLWTAMVCPTKSGEIIEALAQVFTTLFLPLSFIARIFFSNDTVIYGPFFNERLIIYSINLLFVTSFNNILIGLLLWSSCLQALSIQSGTGTWMTSRLTSF